MTAAASTPRANRKREPADVVRRFSLALEARELDKALALLADNVVFINVSLLTVRGLAGAVIPSLNRPRR